MLNTEEMLGPECFCLRSNGGFYLLDTAKSRVISFNAAGEQEGIYQIPSDLSVAKITAGTGDQLYLLDLSKGIIATVEAGKVAKYQIQDLLLDALIDFGVTQSGAPFVSIADEKGGMSYLFTLEGDQAFIVGTKEGRIAGNGKLYKTTLIKDSGCSIGHAGKVSIYDFNGKLENEITIQSDNWIEGAVYLGEEDNNIIIKTHESESDPNNVYFKDIVKKFDKKGILEEISVLPNKHKYVQNDTLMKGSELYHLNTGKNKVSIDKLTFLSTASNTDLNPLKASSFSPASVTSTLPYVNRSLIQATVVSYWQTSWYCSQSNYNTTGGSIRPRYITSPNQNYQCAPYCWGAYDTLTGFQSRQQSGTTCGNIGAFVSATCGVDCSGYVQRCWGINNAKHDTTYLDGSNISFRIAASSLKYGDAWNSTAHIMIYHYTDGYGNYVLYEATTLDNCDRVAHTTRPVSSVQSGYHSIRRCNVTEDV